MKTAITLLLCASFFASFTAKDATEEPVLPSGESFLNGQVIAIRHMILKPGVDPTEVDRFVGTEWNPSQRGYMPGVKILIVKGERGQKVGEYLHLVIFDSKRSRDFYWPNEGTATPAVDAAWMAADTTLMNTLNAKMGDYFETIPETEYTDYVELTR